MEVKIIVLVWKGLVYCEWAVPGERVSGRSSQLPLFKLIKYKTHNCKADMAETMSFVSSVCAMFTRVAWLSIIPRYVNRATRNESHRVTMRVFRAKCFLHLVPLNKLRRVTVPLDACNIEHTIVMCYNIFQTCLVRVCFSTISKCLNLSADGTHRKEFDTGRKEYFFPYK